MNTTQDAQFTDSQWSEMDWITTWLENHPGQHSSSVIARGTRIENIYPLLRWMDQNRHVAADGNGRLRRYGSRG